VREEGVCDEGMREEGIWGYEGGSEEDRWEEEKGVRERVYRKV